MLCVLSENLILKRRAPASGPNLHLADPLGHSADLPKRLSQNAVAWVWRVARGTLIRHIALVALWRFT